MPSGHTTVYIDDDRHWPHVKPGETVLVDTTDREIIFGELYLVRQSRGPRLWQITRTPDVYRAPAESRATAFMRPLNNPVPRFLKDGRLDPSCPIHLSDGPIYLDALEEQIIGRVVGLFVELPYDPAVGRNRRTAA
jgi:hypothetical protein